MEKLEIKNKPLRAIHFGLGILMLVIFISWLLIFLESRKIPDIIYSLVFLFAAIFAITDGFGSGKSFIEVLDNGICIKWSDRIREVTLNDSVIESICLGRYYILINRKNGKSLKLRLGFMDSRLKSKIYRFLIDYGTSRNHIILRSYEKK